MVLSTDSSNDLIASIGSGDTVTLLGAISSNSDVRMTFIDGTSWSKAQLLTAAGLGTPGSDTIAGTSGADILDGRGGSDTVTGGGGNDLYLFRQGYGSLTIDNSSTVDSGAHGTLDFGPGITESNLWFSEQGNDLVVDVLGSSDVVDIKGWFGTDATGTVSTIQGYDGMKIGQGVASLVQAMATYRAANPGFSPTGASIMPADANLHGAIVSAWHT